MCARRGFTLLELMVVVVVVGLLAALLMPIITQTGRVSSRRSACASNLRQIGTAMMMFADVPTNGGLPNAANGDPMLSMNLLYKEYINDVRVFRCPSDKRRPLSGLEKVAPVKDGKIVQGSAYLSKLNCSYGYDPGATISESRQAVAACMPGNHAGAVGQNVLFVGGNVEWREDKVNRGVTDASGKPVIDPDIFAPNPELAREVDSYIRQ